MLRMSAVFCVEMLLSVDGHGSQCSSNDLAVQRSLHTPLNHFLLDNFRFDIQPATAARVSTSIGGVSDDGFHLASGSIHALCCRAVGGRRRASSYRRPSIWRQRLRRVVGVLPPIYHHFDIHRVSSMAHPRTGRAGVRV